MTMDVYVAAPSTPLADAVLVMAENKYGSVVVVDGAKIVGVFTTIDALNALTQLLAEKPRALTGS